MEYDAAGRVIRLTSENGSHTTFRYDVLDRLIQRPADGRTALSPRPDRQTYPQRG
nr:RHS repeat domain-containing protein [Escherichia coli]